jgi:hypothetical protein
MNRNGIAFWVVAGLLVFPLAANAQSANIYSWTDENGVKHFSDKAPVETEAAVEEIPVAQPVAAAAEPEALADDSSTTPDNQALDGTATDPAAPGTPEELSYADQQRLAMEERRKAQRENQAERQRICLKAQDELARVEPNRRVYYTDESGETARMDDVERVELVEENKRLIAEYCD